MAGCILSTGEDCGLLDRSRSPACQPPLLEHQSILVAPTVVSTLQIEICPTLHTWGGGERYKLLWRHGLRQNGKPKKNFKTGQKSAVSPIGLLDLLPLSAFLRLARLTCVG